MIAMFKKLNNVICILQVLHFHFHCRLFFSCSVFIWQLEFLLTLALWVNMVHVHQGIVLYEDCSEYFMGNLLIQGSVKGKIMPLISRRSAVSKTTNSQWEECEATKLFRQCRGHHHHMARRSSVSILIEIVTFHLIPLATPVPALQKM